VDIVQPLRHHGNEPVLRQYHIKTKILGKYSTCQLPRRREEGEK